MVVVVVAVVVIDVMVVYVICIVFGGRHDARVLMMMEGNPCVEKNKLEIWDHRPFKQKQAEKVTDAS